MNTYEEIKNKYISQRDSYIEELRKDLIKEAAINDSFLMSQCIGKELTITLTV